MWTKHTYWVFDIDDIPTLVSLSDSVVPKHWPRENRAKNQTFWQYVGCFANSVSWCLTGVYPFRSCLVVTASEHPSLPGRSNILPQSGCLSRRTSASVRDTGRKHLQDDGDALMQTLNGGVRQNRTTYAGISPTKGTERGEGGARAGLRVLRLDLSLSTTSFNICSWPGNNVRLVGTFSCD